MLAWGSRRQLLRPRQRQSGQCLGESNFGGISSGKQICFHRTLADFRVCCHAARVIVVVALVIR